MSGKPTVISLFAGGGGSSLGYEMAGYKELLAVEYDDNAVDTLKANFPKLKIYHGDIRELTGKECLKLAGIKKGELDILNGSPPCQGFSTAGKRKVTDPRNNLFKEYIRLINEVQPKVFVMENVSGMVKGKMKGKFIEIIKDLKNTGYNVKCKLLNAMWYEVPQSRERLIFIGIQKNIKKNIVYPIKALKNPILAGKAINGYKLEKDLYLDKNKEAYSLWLKCKPGELFSKYHPKKHYFNSYRISKDRPVPTILKTVGLNRTGMYHWDEPALLTIDMIKALTTFPEKYKLFGTFVNQWAKIGNSVPPKMMYHIAKTIKKEILS